MKLDSSGTTYSASMDSTAATAQVVAIQGLFDEIGLDTQVAADFIVKSVAAETVNAVLYLMGAGVATAYLRAAAAFGQSFGKGAGDKLGSYVGERIKEWLKRAREARGRDFTIVIQDPSLRMEIILTGDEPPEALAQLLALVENKKITEIPGRAALVRYREGEGWVRPF